MTDGQGPPLTDESEWVEYAAGNPQFRGRTVVRVRGDGHAVVRHETADGAREYEADLDADALDDLRAVLERHDPREVTPRRTDPVPDEARVSVTVAADDRTVREFRENERYERRELDRLFGAFEAVAADVSDGRVRF